MVAVGGHRPPLQQQLKPHGRKINRHRMFNCGFQEARKLSTRFSEPWKKGPPMLQASEKEPAHFPSLGKFIACAPSSPAAFSKPWNSSRSFFPILGKKSGFPFQYLETARRFHPNQAPSRRPTEEKPTRPHPANHPPRPVSRPVHTPRTPLAHSGLAPPTIQLTAPAVHPKTRSTAMIHSTRMYPL